MIMYSDKHPISYILYCMLFYGKMFLFINIVLLPKITVFV